MNLHIYCTINSFWIYANVFNSDPLYHGQKFQFKNSKTWFFRIFGRPKTRINITVFSKNKTVSGHFKSGHSGFKKKKIQQYCCKLQQKCCKILLKYSKIEKSYSKNKNLRFDGLMFWWKTLQSRKWLNVWKYTIFLDKMSQYCYSTRN